MSAYHTLHPESLDEKFRERQARMTDQPYEPLPTPDPDEAMRNMLEAKLAQAIAEREALVNGNVEDARRVLEGQMSDLGREIEALPKGANRDERDELKGRIKKLIAERDALPEGAKRDELTGQIANLTVEFEAGIKRDELYSRFRKLAAQRQALLKSLPQEDGLTGIERLRASVEQRDQERITQRPEKDAAKAIEKKAAGVMRWAWNADDSCKRLRAAIADAKRLLPPYGDATRKMLPEWREAAISAMMRTVAACGDFGCFDDARLRREAEAFVANFERPRDGAGGRFNAGARLAPVGPEGYANPPSVETALSLWADDQGPTPAEAAEAANQAAAAERQRAQQLAHSRFNGGYGAISYTR